VERIANKEIDKYWKNEWEVEKQKIISEISNHSGKSN
jgi:hypothetical protein